MPQIFINRKAVLTPPLSSYHSLILSDSPVGYWRLGETSGTTIIDEFINHNGTYLNSPTLASQGLISNDLNTSVLFNIGNKGRINNTTSIDLVSNFTLEIWVKTTNTSMNSLIFGTYDGGSNLGHGIGLFNTNVFMAFNGASPLIVSAPMIYDGNPHHIVCTYTGTSPNITGRVYVDGILIGTSLNRSVSSTSFLDIASYTNSSGGMVGNMDEAAIYNYVLTPTQILNHYNAGI